MEEKKQKYHKGNLVHVPCYNKKQDKFYLGEAIILCVDLHECKPATTTACKVFLKDGCIDSIWYNEDELILIEPNRFDLLNEWKLEKLLIGA